MPPYRGEAPPRETSTCDDCRQTYHGPLIPTVLTYDPDGSLSLEFLLCEECAKRLPSIAAAKQIYASRLYESVQRRHRPEDGGGSGGTDPPNWGSGDGITGI